MLSLHEKLFMLAIHEEKGTLIGSSIERLKTGLAGAALAQLALLGSIQATDNHRIKVLKADLTGEDFLDEIIAALSESEKERKFTTWLENLPVKFDKIRKQVSERLVRRGIVTQDDDHFQWTIPSPIHPQVNASGKFGLVQHLREAVLAQKEYGTSDLALLSLLKACDLLHLVFLRDERRYASRHINELLVSGAMQDPVVQTLQEIEHALSIVVEDD